VTLKSYKLKLFNSQKG